MLGGSKREIAKEERRKRILDAAEELIEQTGSTEFSMSQLAEKAKISPYTTYNLIGQKSSVLYVLLNRSLDNIDIISEKMADIDNPVEFVFKAAQNIVEVFTARSDLYRPLFRYLLGSPDPIHRPDFMKRSSDYWCFAFEPLSKAGYLDGAIQKIDLVREAQMFFTGVLEYWVHHDLTDEEFGAYARHGFSIRLLALGIPEMAPLLEKRIAEARPFLTRLIEGQVV